MKSLVIDDDYTSCKIFKTHLERYGICDSVCTGFGGMDAYVEAVNSGEAYDLVVIDIILPDINGYEILRKIRMAEHNKIMPAGRRTKIILATSLDDEENKKLAQKLNGYDEAYYVKSYGLEDFQQKLLDIGVNL